MRTLSQEIVKFKHWHWMKGMLLLDGKGRVVSVEGGYLLACLEGPLDPPILGGRLGEFDAESTWVFPDLDDPGTIGCLLDLVRKAYNDPSLSAFLCHDGVWRIAVCVDASVPGATEKEALAFALQIAP